MEPNDKIIELAKKLYELSQRGIGGEKENAKDKLLRLLEKHGLTLDDIAGEKKQSRYFKYKSKLHRKFVNQVISSVIGKRETYYNVKKKYVRVELTDAEYVEAFEKMEYYWLIYLEEAELFYDAFIQVNHLYRKSNDEEKEDRELTEKEKEEIRKLFRMMQGMEGKSYIKQLKE